MVNLSTVTSVSTHEYVVNGSARVTELTIGTTGAVVARFYYIEPIIPKSPINGFGQSVIDKVQEKVEDATDRAGVEQVWKKVVKDYPVSTHAHTVEYRLDSVDAVTKLEKNIEDAWKFNNKDVFISMKTQ